MSRSPVNHPSLCSLVPTPWPQRSDILKKGLVILSPLSLWGTLSMILTMTLEVAITISLLIYWHGCWLLYAIGHRGNSAFRDLMAVLHPRKLIYWEGLHLKRRVSRGRLNQGWKGKPFLTRAGREFLMIMCCSADGRWFHNWSKVSHISRTGPCTEGTQFVVTQIQC